MLDCLPEQQRKWLPPSVDALLSLKDQLMIADHKWSIVVDTLNLNWLLERHPPPDASKKLVIKFAYDGATMTAGKKIKHEIGTFDLLFDDFSLSLCKSLHTTHQWLVYIGLEDYDTEPQIVGGHPHCQQL